MNGSDYVEDTCASYCPQHVGQTRHAQNGLSLTLQQTNHSDYVTIRKLQLTNGNEPATVNKRIITQVQFQAWKMYDQVSG